MSAGHKGLKHNKWRQLVGVTLIATSSTLLLINVAIFLLFPTKLEGAWINTHVAPFNLESMMSNIGVLFVCGVGVKRESDEAKAGKLAEAAKKKMVGSHASFAALMRRLRSRGDSPD